VGLGGGEAACVNLIVQPFTSSAYSAYSALVLAARSLHDLFYELYFLLAKKLTEAADALYGTLSHMLVFSQ